MPEVRVPRDTDSSTKDAPKTKAESRYRVSRLALLLEETQHLTNRFSRSVHKVRLAETLGKRSIVTFGPTIEKWLFSSLPELQRKLSAHPYAYLGRSWTQSFQTLDCSPIFAQ